MCGMYTNDRYHGACFQTVDIWILKIYFLNFDHTHISLLNIEIIVLTGSYSEALV